MTGGRLYDRTSVHGGRLEHDQQASSLGRIAASLDALEIADRIRELLIHDPGRSSHAQSTRGGVHDAQGGVLISRAMMQHCLAGPLWHLASYPARASSRTSHG